MRSKVGNLKRTSTSIRKITSLSFMKFEWTALSIATPREKSPSSEIVFIAVTSYFLFRWLTMLKIDEILGSDVLIKIDITSSAFWPPRRTTWNCSIGLFDISTNENLNSRLRNYSETSEKSHIVLTAEERTRFCCRPHFPQFLSLSAFSHPNTNHWSCSAFHWKGISSYR